ncbi:heme acquisition protein HasAp, partial [Pseudomonas aeruginosa]
AGVAHATPAAAAAEIGVVGVQELPHDLALAA